MPCRSVQYKLHGAISQKIKCYSSIPLNQSCKAPQHMMCLFPPTTQEALHSIKPLHSFHNTVTSPPGEALPLNKLSMRKVAAGIR